LRFGLFAVDVGVGVVVSVWWGLGLGLELGLELGWVFRLRLAFVMNPLFFLPFSSF